MEFSSCECLTCQGACSEKPGWFVPEQVPLLLKYWMVNDLEELLVDYTTNYEKANKLAIDWWNADGSMILILAPNIKGNYNIQYPADPRGECVFHREDGKCDIYPIRPYECGKYHHNNVQETISKRHFDISRLWAASNILEKFEDRVEQKSFSLIDMIGRF